MKFYQLLKKFECDSMKASIPFDCIWSLCNSKIGLDRRIDQYLIKRQEKQDLFKILNLDRLDENLATLSAYQFVSRQIITLNSHKYLHLPKNMVKTEMFPRTIFFCEAF